MCFMKDGLVYRICKQCTRMGDDGLGGGAYEAHSPLVTHLDLAVLGLGRMAHDIVQNLGQ